jgi:hypothetical protein
MLANPYLKVKRGKWYLYCAHMGRNMIIIFPAADLLAMLIEMVVVFSDGYAQWEDFLNRN